MSRFNPCWWQRFCAILGVCLLTAAAAFTVQAQAGEFSVHIRVPHEGATFYAGPSSLVYNIPINGWVASNQFDLAQIKVEIEIIQQGRVIAYQVTQASADGSFEIFGTVNPHGSTEIFPSENQTCPDVCHTSTALVLPPGALTVRVTATAPDGLRVSRSRQITLDLSGYAEVPVQVVLDGQEGHPLSGIPVRASTWLYMWRARHAMGTTDSTGAARLKLEALSQAPTHYRIQVEPAVVNGVLYQSLAPVDVTLPPGTTRFESPIRLVVTARKGQITGRLAGAVIPQNSPAAVWAIQLPEGIPHTVQTQPQGEFAFGQIPLDDYLVVLDSAWLVQQGLAAKSQRVTLDRAESSPIELQVRHLLGVSVQGQVTDASARPLPFAWATAEKAGTGARVAPSGEFRLDGLEAALQPVIFSAPGYYSRVVVADLRPGPARLDASLAIQPGTRQIPWGDGQITLPAETLAQATESSITLEAGWLWGSAAGSETPLRIHLAGAEISLLGGAFAIEAPAGQAGWLYIFTGQAQVWKSGSPDEVMVQPGQMLSLDPQAAPQAAPLEPVVISALHPEQAAPLPFIWEPSVRAQMRDRLALIGVSTAQVITFITYISVFISVVILPLVGLYLWLKRRSHLAGRHS